MSVVKQIVCLANSRMPGGRCVAGIEVVEGHRVGWIRPVSDREGAGVSMSEQQYEDSSYPRVLDVIDVPLLKACPYAHQQENWRLDPNRYWHKAGRATWRALDSLVDPIAPLWLDGCHTKNGVNDKVPLTMVNNLRSSLRLIRVDQITLVVYKTGEEFGNPKRNVQGRFRYDGTEYWLRVTDPKYEQRYRTKPTGCYEISESFLTVSLAKPFKDACYKLIAAIIERPGDSS